MTIFVACLNLLVNLSMKEFRKSVNIRQSYGQDYNGSFLTHSVYRLQRSSAIVPEVSRV